MTRFHIHLTALLSASSLIACDRDQDQAHEQAHEQATSDADPLPDLGQVPAFSFTNQKGEPFGTEQLTGRPYVAAFMFTRCPSICPRLTAKMKQVDSTVHEAGLPLDLISISVDPEYDTPQALSAYAKKYGADPKRWNFLTGDFNVIAKTAEQGFKVALAGQVDENKPHLGITHASHLILVDAQGHIRGYFRTSDDDVDAQIVEALRKL